MRKSSILLAVLILGLGLGGVSRAATLEWEGSAVVSLASLQNLIFTGTGVATVNGSGGLGDLTQIRFAGGITGSNTNFLTDPKNPTVVTLIVTGHLGTGTITGISGGVINGNDKLPVVGSSKLCLLFPGCATYLVIPMTLGGTRGVGLGGVLTVNTFTPPGGNGVRISLTGAPWTLGVTTMTGVETINGAMPTTTSATTTLTGFIHGPASATSSAAAVGGVLQMVGISAITTNLVPPDDKQALLQWGRFHFIPEPGLLLLLGSGVAGLVVLGAGRARP
jgi:hypothetical protein